MSSQHLSSICALFGGFQFLLGKTQWNFYLLGAVLCTCNCMHFGIRSSKVHPELTVLDGCFGDVLPNTNCRLTIYKHLHVTWHGTPRRSAHMKPALLDGNEKVELLQLIRTTVTQQQNNYSDEDCTVISLTFICVNVRLQATNHKQNCPCSNKGMALESFTSSGVCPKGAMFSHAWE